MPRIYLSPSVQEFNFDVNGVSEETMMNYIADAMEPLLRLNGIDFTRNRPSMSVPEIIAESNRGQYDLHFALHSNAAPPGAYGTVRGSRAYYRTGSQRGEEYAGIFANTMKKLYPLPDLVGTIATDQLGELNDTLAPAVLYEIAYHDNFDDSAFITENVQNIAANLVESICKIFGKTMIPVCLLGSTPAQGYQYTGPAYGRACTAGGALNFRDRPNGNILLQLPAGEQMIVRGRSMNGATPVRYNAINGYVATQYLCICNSPALPFSAQLGRVNTDGGYLNIRQLPNLESGILAKAPNNALLVVLNDNNDFYHVNYNGANGYALRQYVEII